MTTTLLWHLSGTALWLRTQVWANMTPLRKKSKKYNKLSKVFKNDSFLVFKRVER